MSINNAILGILSYQSLTGYDLKKIIQDSPFMHWSGNNNQIYKALVELLEDGYVTNEVCHQESSPSKKIYTITEEGKSALKQWVLSRPEPPEQKKTFLIQLAWADQLNGEELNELLTGYENEVKVQVLMHQEKKLRATFKPDRTKKEALLWEMIHQNIISTYKNELDWIQELRKQLNIQVKESKKMDYKMNDKDGNKYIELINVETALRSEQDALDIISICLENDIFRVMIHSDLLNDDFFKLKTKVAGEMLQKFVNYRTKVAIVLNSEDKIKGKFKELLAETNKGNDYRVFSDAADAENWLVGVK